VKEVEYGDIAKFCGSTPPYLPKNEPARIVTIGGVACPCGGTHVKKVEEIGSFSVTKLTKRKNAMRVTYKLE